MFGFKALPFMFHLVPKLTLHVTNIITNDLHINFVAFPFCQHKFPCNSEAQLVLFAFKTWDAFGMIAEFTVHKWAAGSFNNEMYQQVLKVM